jgi:predicted Rossmann fold nucleotide-binding protein DprA/Smf involved in DNA uptake
MPQVPDVRTIAKQIKARITDLEEQLKQRRDLNDELARLRDALSRLEGEATARVRGRRPAAKRPARKPATAPNGSAAATGTGGANRTKSRSVAPRGQTRQKVLEALKEGPKTAGEVAAATGVPRASASTTLNKLAKSGDVVKAERGYRLPA